MKNTVDSTAAHLLWFSSFLSSHWLRAMASCFTVRNKNTVVNLWWSKVKPTLNLKEYLENTLSIFYFELFAHPALVYLCFKGHILSHTKSMGDPRHEYGSEAAWSSFTESRKPCISQYNKFRHVTSSTFPQHVKHHLHSVFLLGLKMVRYSG